MKRIWTIISAFLLSCLFLFGCIDNAEYYTPTTPQRYTISYVAVINDEIATIPAGMYRVSGNYPSEYVEETGVEIDALKNYIEGNVFYQFEGWFSDKACTQAVEEISSLQVGNVTLYAKIKKIFSSTVSYFAVIDGVKTSIPVGMYKTNGNYPSKYTETVGAEVDALEDYEAGDMLYEFEGWFLDQACTQAMEAISSSQTGNIILYAKIKKTVEPAIVTKTITYYAVIDGETSSVPAVMYDLDSTKYPASYTIGVGAVIGDLLSTKEYAFEGWFLDEECNNAFTGVSDVMDTDVTLYARVKRIKEKSINYYAIINGEKETIPPESYGSNTSLYPSTYVIGVGATIGDLVDTTTYLFNGWYLDEACETPFTGISTTEDADVTVYAKLTFADPNRKVIEYKAVINGKVTAMPAILFDASRFPTTCTVGETLTLGNLPSNVDGQDFKGWYLDEACTIKFTGTVETDSDTFTVYAKIKKTYHTGFYD